MKMQSPTSAIITSIAAASGGSLGGGVDPDRATHASGGVVQIDRVQGVRARRDSAAVESELAKLKEAFLSAALTTAMVMLILGASTVFSNLLTRARFQSAIPPRKSNCTTP